MDGAPGVEGTGESVPVAGRSISEPSEMSTVH